MLCLAPAVSVYLLCPNESSMGMLMQASNIQ